APIPLGRSGCFARLLPVMRQECGALVELLRIDRRDCLRRRRVSPRPTLSELRAIRHFLRQRMFEGIFRSRVEGLFVDELASSELPERLAELGLGQLCD